MEDCLVLFSCKNKSIVFIDLQAKLTGSNPVALTTFLEMVCGKNAMTLLITHFYFQIFLKNKYQFIPKIFSILLVDHPARSIAGTKF